MFETSRRLRWTVACLALTVAARADGEEPPPPARVCLEPEGMPVDYQGRVDDPHAGFSADELARWRQQQLLQRAGMLYRSRLERARTPSEAPRWQWNRPMPVETAPRTADDPSIEQAGYGAEAPISPPPSADVSLPPTAVSAKAAGRPVSTPTFSDASPIPTAAQGDVLAAGASAPAAADPAVTGPSVPEKKSAPRAGAVPLPPAPVSTRHAAAPAGPAAVSAAPAATVAATEKSAAANVPSTALAGAGISPVPAAPSAGSVSPSAAGDARPAATASVEAKAPVASKEFRRASDETARQLRNDSDVAAKPSSAESAGSEKSPSENVIADKATTDKAAAGSVSAPEARPPVKATTVEKPTASSTVAATSTKPTQEVRTDAPTGPDRSERTIERRTIVAPVALGPKAGRRLPPPPVSTRLPIASVDHTRAYNASASPPPTTSPRATSTNAASQKPEKKWRFPLLGRFQKKEERAAKPLVAKPARSAGRTVSPARNGPAAASAEVQASSGAPRRPAAPSSLAPQVTRQPPGPTPTAGVSKPLPAPTIKQTTIVTPAVDPSKSSGDIVPATGTIPLRSEGSSSVASPSKLSSFNEQSRLRSMTASSSPRNAEPSAAPTGSTRKWDTYRSAEAPETTAAAPNGTKETARTGSNLHERRVIRSVADKYNPGVHWEPIRHRAAPTSSGGNGSAPTQAEQPTGPALFGAPSK